MTDQRKTWKVAQALAAQGTTVIEASAGTGKTWQIEALVVRLVAEKGIAISRLLVITFTEAATAELRDKIRRRLTQARDALADLDAPTQDELIKALRKTDPTIRLARLRQALADFDEAPISTIHGFCQRMLTQLAFESHVEPDLQLFTDVDALRETLVADELAKVFAEASASDVVLLKAMGWKRDKLTDVAKAMTSAVALEAIPNVPEGTLGVVNPRDVLPRWREAVEEYRAWLEGPAGVAAVEAMRVVNEKVRDKKKSPLQYKRYNHQKTNARVREWLDTDAVGLKPLADVSSEPEKWWTPAWAVEDERWVGGLAALEQFEGYELFVRTSRILSLRHELWAIPLVGFARRVRAAFDAKVRTSGLLTFDGMLSRLSERVDEEQGNGPLSRAIRLRYDVALVDEFQDTDTAQWTILRAAFGSEPAKADGRRLFLVGDPKQSIYSFRGADLDVYLDATHGADGDFALDTNYRSDRSLVEATNHVWLPCLEPFGTASSIPYVRVSASRVQERLSLLPGVLRDDGSGPRRALEVRWVDARSCGLYGDNNKIAAGGLLRFLADRCAGECVRLIEAGAVVSVPSRDAHLLAPGQGLVPEGARFALAGTRSPTHRYLHAGDIAVLVQTHKQGTAVREALRRANVPSVGGGKRKLWDSDALGWLCAWLDAVASPDDERTARALAVTPLIGWTASQLSLALADDDTSSTTAAAKAENAVETDDPWRRLRASVTTAANRWSTQGFFRTFHSALSEDHTFDKSGHASFTRLLGMPDGERAATDLRHLAELAHLEERRARLGPGSLADWLRRQAEDSDTENEAPVRLESDDRAVKIVTIHACKGLQYPVTLLPFAGSPRHLSSSTAGLRVRLPARTESANSEPGRLCLDLHLSGSPERERSSDAQKEAARGESRRLLYVAMTRAEHHIVAWIGTQDAHGEALNGILLGTAEPNIDPPAPVDVVPGSKGKKPKNAPPAEPFAPARVPARLTELAESSGNTLGWATELPEVDGTRLVRTRGAGRALLQADRWPQKRALGAAWQVASFSSIAGGKKHAKGAPAQHGTPPEGGETESDAAAANSQEGAAPFDAQWPETIAAEPLPGGIPAGSWVHGVLEMLDFATAKPRPSARLATPELGDLLTQQREKHGVAEEVRHGPDRKKTALASDLLAAALQDWLRTPLDRTGAGATSAHNLPAGFCLSDLPLERRFDELLFDLSVVGGTGHHAVTDTGDGPPRVDEGAVRRALESRLHDQSFTGLAWLRALLERLLADKKTLASVFPSIGGILTGSIDLLFRASADGPFYISDYKTNRLVSPTPDSGERFPSRRGNYAVDGLAHAMGKSNYHLQALIYTVALHRMLRQRLPEYDYDKHVGGHLYLFLRGMEGANTPRSASGHCLGVYYDRWPRSVVEGLDLALTGARRASVDSFVTALEGKTP